MSTMDAIFFDLEFIGNLNESVSHCRIYEVAAVKPSGDEFHSYVDPGEPYIQPVVGTLPRRELLIDPLQRVLERFVEWIGPAPCYLVSHGNFRSDQRVLRAQNATIPNHIRFVDSLMITRAMIHSTKFSLSFLYEFLGHGKIDEPHSALHDARATKKIMDGLPDWRRYACSYSLHIDALSNIKGIGAKTELYLHNSGWRRGDMTTWECLGTLTQLQVEGLFSDESH